MTNVDLANLIFPEIKDIEYYEKQYPNRNIKEKAQVTRIGPSPTGNVHIGTIFQALINKTIARQSEGVFFARIEDTDQKRMVEDGIEQIITSLEKFELLPDESMTIDGENNGEYGPYKQSDRINIYKAYAKYLISIGKAYPCFCSAEDLERSRLEQEQGKINTGYYGEWACCRQLSINEMIARIENDEKYHFA